jgi:hypothetical protein
MSPASKAWAAEHDHLLELEAKRVCDGRPLNRGEPIPWVLYVPKEPIHVAEPISITLPEPCVVKGSAVHGRPCTSPRKPAGQLLDSIPEEQEDDVITASYLSEDSIWSQDSAEFSVSDLPPLALDVPAPSSVTDNPVPSILVDECSDSAMPHPESVTAKIAFASIPIDMDFLQVPIPGVTRPVLGVTTNLSNVTGSKFKLAAPRPRKGGHSKLMQSKLKPGKENTPPSGYL